jgi:hypothetical protein
LELSKVPADTLHPDLPVTDFFAPVELVDHPDFRTKVVLRPQESGVHATESRSWFGGMPQMPAELPWPEGPSGKMVFIAQICCADFPSMLWGGIGPRTGWLLLFLDALPVGGEPYSRVLHITELGPARHEGSDIDVSMTWSANRTASPLSEPIFRHVPVELVKSTQGPLNKGASEYSMGGLPVQGWHEPDHMTTSAYARPELRLQWANEMPYLKINPAADQEVLLFELISDKHIGWIWGDVNHAVIRMPRGDLVTTRFDRAKLEIDAG